MAEIINLLIEHKRKLLVIGIVAELAILALAFITSEGNLPLILKQAARISARLSLLFFAFVVFIYTSKNTDASSEKYLFTRNFAIIHFVHWIFLMSSMYVNEYELEIPRIIPGVLAYLTLLATPILYKFKIFSGRILLLWERWYLWIVWLLFFLTYIMRLTRQSPHASGGVVSYGIGLLFVCLIAVYYILNYKKHKLS